MVMNALTINVPGGFLNTYSAVSLTTSPADIITATSAQRLRIFGIYWYVDAGAELLIELAGTDILRVNTTNEPVGFINLYPLFIDGALNEDLTGVLNTGTANGYFTIFYTIFVL